MVEWKKGLFVGIFEKKIGQLFTAQISTFKLIDVCHEVRVKKGASNTGCLERKNRKKTKMEDNYRL